MKITKDGFEFNCVTPEDIKMVMKSFQKELVREVVHSPKRTYKKHKKYVDWNIEEAQILLKAVAGGIPIKNLYRHQLLVRHTPMAIYNQCYNIRHGQKTKLFKKAESYLTTTE